MDPEESPIMKFFGYNPESPSKDMNRRFAILAQAIEDDLPRGPEKSVALRKLLEAKDAVFRSLWETAYEKT